MAHNLPVNWAKELFKPSKDAVASLHVFWLVCLRLGAQPQQGSVSVKFLLETRLESEPFEPLIAFLAFLIQKLRSKINKIINYLIKGLIKYFVYFRS